MGQETVINNIISLGLMDAAEATPSIDCSEVREFSVYIISDTVSTGAVIKIESSPDDSNFAEIGTVTVSGDGTQVVAISGEIHKWVRARASSYTDGNHTAKLLK